MSSSNQGERARVAAIDRLGVLDRPSGGRFDPVIRLAQRVFDVPVVAVNVVGADRMHTIDAVGVPCGSVPRDLSFCTYTVDQEQTFVVPDTSRDARFARNPLTRHGFRFYAGHPLTVAGHRIGSLCLVDDHPRSLGAAEEVLLADLARWVEDQMQLEDAEFQAEEVQRRLLPRRKPQVPGYDVAGGNAAARLVSGDYYDWQQLDDGFQIVVADVMGKGITAAIVAAAVRALIRGASRYSDLPQAFRRAADNLAEDLADARCFVTVFAARLTPATGHLAWVDAGHGLAIIVSADAEEARVLDARGLPLGVLDDEWVLTDEHLAPGETLLVVSDGILDYFPDPWAAVEAARLLVGLGGTAQQMVDEILAYPGEQALSDDVTVVVLRREPS